MNPSDSTRDKAELGLPPAVSGSLLFCRENNWEILSKILVKTPLGSIQMEDDQLGTPKIDTELIDKVFKAEEIQEGKGSRVKKLMKLHRYFGHCSGDSLWRVIKYLSNTSEYTATEVKEVCDTCHICQYSKRKMPRKKTSLPRSTGFNQVVTMDLKCHRSVPMSYG